MSMDSLSSEPVLQVHLLFRGASEVAKILRSVAFGFEVIVAASSAYLIFAENDALEVWHPLVAFLALALARVIRVKSRDIDRFAEGCRRESARAFACGGTISPRRLSSLRSDAPWISIDMANKLPASTLEAYYEPTCPIGQSRLREMYASSAFHTWHLARLWYRCLVVGLALLTCFSVVALYMVASTDGELVERAQMIEALFSFVLLFLWLELAEAVYAAWGTYRSVRPIGEDLLSPSLTTDNELRGLVHDYDFERTGGTSIPTFLYSLDRKRLEREWAECRLELNC